MQTFINPHLQIKLFLSLQILDKVLGGDHASLFRRKQLKALLSIHGKEEGFGGKLSPDEIQIISGALDLTTKIAYHAMTPIEKVRSN